MFLQPTFIQQPRKSVGTGQMGRAVKFTGNAKNRLFDFPQSIPYFGHAIPCRHGVWSMGCGVTWTSGGETLLP